MSYYVGLKEVSAASPSDQQVADYNNRGGWSKLRPGAQATHLLFLALITSVGFYGHMFAWWQGL